MLQSTSAITGTFVPASDQVGPIRDSPALHCLRPFGDPVDGDPTTSLRCSVGACRPRVKHAAEVRCSVSAAARWRPPRDGVRLYPRRDLAVSKDPSTSMASQTGRGAVELITELLSVIRCTGSHDTSC